MVRDMLSLEPQKAICMVVLVAHEIVIVVSKHGFLSKFLDFIRDPNLLEKGSFRDWLCLKFGLHVVVVARGRLCVLNLELFFPEITLASSGDG